MIYTVTLNPALDRSIGPEGERIDPGGKGLNVAKTLNAFGYEAAAVCLTAGGNGEALRRLAAAAQIDLIPVPTPGETRVNLKLFDGETVTEHNQPGPAFSPAAFVGLRERLSTLLRPGDTLALCGSLPPDTPADAYATLAAAHPDCRIIVDTSGPALAAALTAGPDCIKPNLAELEQLTGTALPDTTSRIEALQALMARGAKRVLLSLGGEGAMLATARGVWYAAAPQVPVQGTVGAGDAMTAVLCALPMEDEGSLLRACVAAGSAAVMQPGSVPPLRSDWERLIGSVRSESVCLF